MWYPVFGHVNECLVEVFREELPAKLNSSLAAEEQEELAHSKSVGFGQFVQDGFNQVVSPGGVVLVYH